MSYEEAVAAIVSKQEVIAELAKHNASVEEFFAEVGERASYKGSTVLDWLGY